VSGRLFTEADLKRICQEAVRAAGGSAEAAIDAKTVELTRFANNVIHQNVASREAQLRIRVADGKRVGMVSTNDITTEGIARAAAAARDVAKRVPENASFAGLPHGQPIPKAPSAFADRTSSATPLDRAKRLEVLLRRAREAKLTAAGYLSTSTHETAIASSEGVWAYSPSTIAALETVAMGDGGSAWAERNSIDLDEIDVASASEEAVGKCMAAKAPRDMPHGTYEVVLETYAVNDIGQFLADVLTGEAVEEGRSFVGGKLGQKVTGDVTIVDDPFDPELVPCPFDGEGQPSQKVTLIEKGIARAVVYDHQTAARTGNKSTGHALPPNPAESASPQHLRIEAGTKTREQLIGEVDRGILVTRFHYTRWVHQLRTIVTGMTRDGTFLIEKGEIAYPVKNFRFTQSYHEALGGTLGIGKDLQLFAAGEWITGQRRVPALRLGSFSFTGSTSF